MVLQPQAKGQQKANAQVIRSILEETLTQRVPAHVDVERTFGISIPPSERANLTYARLLVYRLMMQACAGDNRALKEVLDRFMGKTAVNKDQEAQDQNYVDFLRSLDPHAVLQTTALDQEDEDDLGL